MWIHQREQNYNENPSLCTLDTMPLIYGSIREKKLPTLKCWCAKMTVDKQRQQDLGLVFFTVTHFSAYATDSDCKWGILHWRRQPTPLHSYTAGWVWPGHTCTVLLFESPPDMALCQPAFEALLERPFKSCPDVKSVVPMSCIPTAQYNIGLPWLDVT